jgi:hypothetical protein
MKTCGYCGAEIKDGEDFVWFRMKTVARLPEVNIYSCYHCKPSVQSPSKTVRRGMFIKSMEINLRQEAKEVGMNKKQTKSFVAEMLEFTHRTMP